ncbi:tetratricopeptide repeat protein, partial [Gemmatimonadota bacterium]
FDDYVQERWGERMQAVAPQQERGEGVRIFHAEVEDIEGLRLWVLENPGNFPARLALGRAYFEAERLDEAEGQFRAALILFPEYGGPDSPFLYLARIHRRRGELELAARALQQLGGLNETLYSVHIEAAELWLELGETGEAAQALEKAVEIIPFEMENRRSLAELYSELGDHEGAVLERRAVLALDPVDRADAHYRLALALKDAGEANEARSQVLRALEIAPTFEEALELLLVLRGGTP